MPTKNIEVINVFYSDMDDAFNPDLISQPADDEAFFSELVHLVDSNDENLLRGLYKVKEELHHALNMLNQQERKMLLDYHLAYADKVSAGWKGKLLGVSGIGFFDNFKRSVIMQNLYYLDLFNTKLQAFNEIWKEDVLYETFNFKDGKPLKAELQLSVIFSEKANGYEVCKELLEELDLTINGIPNTKPGRVGKLTGLITALKETGGMPRLDKPTNMELLTYFNNHLGTAYKTFSTRNEHFKESVDLSQRYIKQNFRK